MALTTSEIKDPTIATALQRLQQDLRKSTPITDFEYVDVTFPSTTNTDVIVPTRLRPDLSDNINYTIVGLDFLSAPATTPCIYKDVSSTRHPWGVGYIVLRSNVASFTAHLKLEIKRVNKVN